MRARACVRACVCVCGRTCRPLATRWCNIRHDSVAPSRGTDVPCSCTTPAQRANPSLCLPYCRNSTYNGGVPSRPSPLRKTGTSCCHGNIFARSARENVVYLHYHPLPVCSVVLPPFTPTLLVHPFPSIID